MEEIKSEILEKSQKIAHRMYLEVLDVINEDFPESEEDEKEMDAEKWCGYVVAFEMLDSMILTNIVANKYVNFKDHNISKAKCLTNTIKNIKRFIKIYEDEAKERLKE